jgi:hypothetical protein
METEGDRIVWQRPGFESHKSRRRAGGGNNNNNNNKKSESAKGRARGKMIG